VRHGHKRNSQGRSLRVSIFNAAVRWRELSLSPLLRLAPARITLPLMEVIAQLQKRWLIWFEVDGFRDFADRLRPIM